jgi:TonB family protein
MRAGFAGSVILSAEVDAEGRVLDARVAQGIPLLTKPAIDAVRLWRYEPFLMNGAAVPFILTVRIDFSAVAMPAGIDAGLLADLVKGEDAQDSRDAVDFIANRAHRIKRADRAKLVKALDVLLASDPSPTVEEAATRARERLSETR